MRLLPTPSASGLLPLALTALTLVSRCSGQDTPKDLDQVLSTRPELSIFWGMIENNTDFLFQLPTLGGVTLIAPTNESFTRIQGFDPKNKTAVNFLLQYHTLLGTYTTDSIVEGQRVFAKTKLTDRSLTNVTAGQSVLIDKQRGGEVVVTSGSGSRAALTQPDIAFAGGVVHVAEALLSTPARLETTGLTAYKELTAFVAALYAADLVPQFAESKDVTIFAPRNAAFQLLSGTLTGLDKKSLARVLGYHIVPGRVIPAAELKNDTKLLTAADGARAELGVHRAGNDVWLNSAKVVQTDLLIANGVVHIIDGVLNPDVPGVLPNPEIEVQPPVFAVSGTGAATSTGARASIPFTTALPCTVNCPVPTTASATAAARTSSSTSVRTTSSQGGAAGQPAGPRCTGAVMGAAALAGVVGGVLGGGFGVL